VKPPQDGVRDYSEKVRVLFAQWDSLVLEGSVLYRRYHYPDGTTRYLQVVLPVKLRRPYMERMHADLGHFGRTKTCLVLTHRAYFPRWRLLTGLVVRNCLTCNMHQRSYQKPMREFRPTASMPTWLVHFLKAKTAGIRGVFSTFSLSWIPLLVTYGFCPFVTKQLSV